MDALRKVDLRITTQGLDGYKACIEIATNDDGLELDDRN